MCWSVRRSICFYGPSDFTESTPVHHLSPLPGIQKKVVVCLSGAEVRSLSYEYRLALLAALMHALSLGAGFKGSTFTFALCFQYNPSCLFTMENHWKISTTVKCNIDPKLVWPPALMLQEWKTTYNKTITQTHLVFRPIIRRAFHNLL